MTLCANMTGEIDGRFGRHDLVDLNSMTTKCVIDLDLRENSLWNNCLNVEEILMMEVGRL